jgi:glycosyltransferase involved in cell wall biosynthesis
MAAPLVTIAMPVRNAGPAVAAAVRSILAQSFADWEFLVIDDGSTDATAAIVAGFADPRLRLIRHAQTRGLAVRLNEAISQARGRLFARMDGDDIAYPARLEAQVNFMAGEPCCDLVACGMLIFDDAGRIRGRFPLRSTHEEICAHPWRGFFLPHPTWLGRVEWFRRHRYLEQFKRSQDQDLLLRTFDTSRFASLDRVLLGYRQDRRTIDKSLRGRAYFARSILREAARRRAYGIGAAAVAAQMAKGLADLVTIPLGLGDRLGRANGAALDAAAVAEWAALWEACAGPAGARA